MASKRYPLELSYQAITFTRSSASGTEVAQGEIDLDLLPDQIAEIHQIDSYLSISTVVDGANIAASGALSMNPDENDDPLFAAAQRRLEFFYHQDEEWESRFDTEGRSVAMLYRNKQMKFYAKPYLVGTNIGVVANANNTSATEVTGAFQARCYFTRRKASAQELNQILLKRR